MKEFRRQVRASRYINPAAFGLLRVNRLGSAHLKSPLSLLQIVADVPGYVISRAFPKRQNTIETSIAPEPLFNFSARVPVKTLPSDKTVLVESTANVTVLVGYHAGDWRRNLPFQMLDEGIKQMPCELGAWPVRTGHWKPPLPRIDHRAVRDRDEKKPLASLGLSAHRIKPFPQHTGPAPPTAAELSALGPPLPPRLFAGRHWVRDYRDHPGSYRPRTQKIAPDSCPV